MRRKIGYVALLVRDYDKAIGHRAPSWLAPDRMPCSGEWPIMTDAGNDRRIDYIELGVADLERSKAFYGTAFGWTFTDYGPTYCEFSDGRLHGGFTTATPPRPGGPLVILYGVDLADLQDRVAAAGGRIVKPIFAFPGGRRFHFLDPDGYELAVWSKQ